MNKTHLVRTLECGCKERFWLFGREIIERAFGCKLHNVDELADQPPDRVYAAKDWGK